MNWVEAALRLESRLDLSRIPRSVASKIESLDTIYVACSGGADSVFALLVLRARLAGRLGECGLRVLHYDHALRGEASSGDASFVEGLCSSLRIPFSNAKAKWADGTKMVSESVARNSRLAFFREASGAVTSGPVFIATGHHADDVVETMLMRLTRGAGIEGLCAPREISEAGQGLVFLRPILDWSRAEIRSALEEAGIPWREDESNQSDSNYRARLRKETIPVWEKAADRPVRPGIGRSRRMLAEDAEALAFAARDVWNSCWDATEQALRRGVFESLPIALQRRVLRMLPNGQGVASDAMNGALRALDSGESLRLEVEPGLFYEFSSQWLRLSKLDLLEEAPSWPEFVLPRNCIAYLPGGEKLSCEKVVLIGSLREKVISGSNNDQRVVYLSGEGNYSLRVVVRRRNPGDAFKPLGKSSPKKLKNLFIDRKINRNERNRLPVFVSEASGILWVPGLPPNADKKLGFGSEAALRLTYDR